MRRLLAMTFALLVSAPLATSQNAKPEATLTDLRNALADVMKLGKSADRALVKARRALKVRAAVPVLRRLSKSVKKMKAGKTNVTKEEIATKVKHLSKLLGTYVSMGKSAIAPTSEALGQAGEAEKAFLGHVKSQLYVQVALDEIDSYLKNGRNPGVFLGMFPKTTELGREGAEAMVKIFTDIDLPASQRNLAGEGVAQLGEKQDLESVREVYADDLEEAMIRESCKFILGRLGDMTLVNKEIAKVHALIKDAEPKVEKARKEMKPLIDKRKELLAVSKPTDEQKKELKAVEGKLMKAQQALVSATLALGQHWNGRARISQNLHKYPDTEQFYKKSLAYWTQVAGAIRHPNFRGAMANAYYNLACVQSLQGKAKTALANLEHGCRWGYNDYDWMGKDGDLKNVRALPEYAKLATELKSGKAKERWKAEAEKRRKAAMEDAKKATGDSANSQSSAPDGI